MKKIFFPSVIVVLLIGSAITSCSNTADSVEVQHDTIKADTAKVKAKDSVIANGEYIKHYQNGVIQMRGMMKDGKREGLWKSWYDNGSPWSETTFEGGKKNGRTSTWYENEKKRYDGFYTNDTESGNWTFWNEEGKLIKMENYSNR